MVALRTDVRDIHQRLTGQLPLKAKGESFSVGVAKILFERAILCIRETRRARGRRWKLSRPVRIAPTRCSSTLVDHDGIGCGCSEVERESLRIEWLVADLITAPPHKLVIAKQPPEQSRGKRR